MTKQARDFVLALLADGPLSSQIVFSEGARNGISEGTLRRALNILTAEKRIETYKERGSSSGQWLWAIRNPPEQPNEEPPAVDTVIEEKLTPLYQRIEAIEQDITRQRTTRPPWPRPALRPEDV